MALSNSLLTQFAKTVNDSGTSKSETTHYGTIIVRNGIKYAKLDGSELLTPVISVADAKDGERVTVVIRNHTATVTGNISSPAARNDDVKNVQNDVKKVQENVATLNGEISTLLRIESSRGILFKNDSISTVLSAVIYHGSKRITDMETLKFTFGDTAYLQWKWQRLGEESYGLISADDHRIGNEGFTFTLSPNDVDTRVTFMCELVV